MVMISLGGITRCGVHMVNGSEVRGRRRVIGVVVVGAALAVVGLTGQSPGGAAAADPVVVAAGDISCAGGATSGCGQQDATASLIKRIAPKRVLPLGDLHYGATRTAAEFKASYGPGTTPSWGDFKSITSPTIGSHEYDGFATAAGYYAYWNGSATASGPAGPPSTGYYAETIGSWRLIHANSQKGGNSATQLAWLKAQLASAPKCSMVLWHHPRYSSGTHGNQSRATDLFAAAYAGKADVVLSGNDHLYERFKPQNANAGLDAAGGVTQFVVGTGGRSLYSWGSIKPNSAYRNNSNYGVLKLTLHSSSYTWAFVTVGDKVLDSGTGTCH
jgi:hypothetical protein